jgi:hypothetical protein
LNASDAVATGTNSVHFARADSPSGNDAGMTFSMTGCAAGSTTTLNVQGSNGFPSDNQGTPLITPSVAAMDATFNTFNSVTGNGATTDTGRSSFYRVNISGFQAGDVPVVIVKR